METLSAAEIGNLILGGIALTGAVVYGLQRAGIIKVGGSKVAESEIQIKDILNELNVKIDKKANKTDCLMHVSAFEEALEKRDKKFEKIMETNSQILQMVARIDERTKKQNGGI